MTRPTMRSYDPPPMYAAIVSQPRGDLHMTPELLEALDALIFHTAGITITAITATGATDLTLIHWRTIVTLKRHGSCNLGALATMLGMSAPSASRLVHRLQDRGIVDMEKNGRLLNIRLSTAGIALSANVITERHNLIQKALGDTKIPNTLLPGLRTITEALATYH